MAVHKAYVQVQAIFDTQGGVLPQVIFWEDGTQYRVDRVYESQRAASLKAGGTGIRYRIRIGGRQSYIWREDSDRWFVEAKK